MKTKQGALSLYHYHRNLFIFATFLKGGLTGSYMAPMVAHSRTIKRLYRASLEYRSKVGIRVRVKVGVWVRVWARVRARVVVL